MEPAPRLVDLAPQPLRASVTSSISSLRRIEVTAFQMPERFDLSCSRIFPRWLSAVEINTAPLPMICLCG